MSCILYNISYHISYYYIYLIITYIIYCIIYHIVSYHIMSYILSYHILYHYISYRIVYHILLYLIITYHILYRIISYITSYHIYHIYLIITYHIYCIISYHISYRIVSYHVISYHISYIIYHIAVYVHCLFCRTCVDSALKCWCTCTRLHEVARSCNHPVAPIPCSTHALTSPCRIDAICVYAHNQGQTKSTQLTYQESSCVAAWAKRRAESCLACWWGCLPDRLRAGDVTVA